MPELLAFTAEHVQRLTGLSGRQLSYWDATGFFSPQVVSRRRAFGRIYTFRDVVGLRTIAILRNEHKVPLQVLRRVGTWLHQHHDTPWANLTFYVAGRRVYFDDPRSGARMGGDRLEQSVLPIAMKRIASSVGRDAKQLQSRTPDEIGQIIRSRYVVHNAPVIAGTRIPVAAIWNLHSAGYSTNAIIREYPRLHRKDVVAAIACEKQRLRAQAS